MLVEFLVQHGRLGASDPEPTPINVAMVVWIRQQRQSDPVCLHMINGITHDVVHEKREEVVKRINRALSRAGETWTFVPVTP